MQIQNRKRIAATLNQLIKHAKSDCCDAPVQYFSLQTNSIPRRICMKCKQPAPLNGGIEDDPERL